MSTLYRDYRPQNFSDVIGQNHIKITLQNEIVSGRLAHAYLFCGPRAVGKTTMARVLAKAVNCENRKEKGYEPCNKCASCISITNGQNLDVVEIDAASNTGVDNVRENVIAFSRLAPSGGKYKVFIIDEVHMLSISAFNALLKVVEEPPAQVIFILCTTEIQKVPGTIVSRCERFDFKRISVSDIVKKLSYIASAEKISLDTEVLEAVARRSGGHLRDAESLLGQIFALGDKKITSEQAELVMPRYNSNEAIDLLDSLSRKDAAKAIAVINNLVDSGVNMKIFTGEIVSLLRKAMLTKTSPELADNLGLDLGENLEKRLAQTAANLSWEQMIYFTRRFLEAMENKNAFIAQLPLELVIVELCFGTGQRSSSNDNYGNGAKTSASINTAKSVSVKSSKVEAPLPPRKEAKLQSQSSEQAKENINSDINLTKSDLMAKWPEFLVKIKKYNHSLSFIMQNCEAREIKEGILYLAFKYKFHQDRLKDNSINSIVSQVLTEVFGSGLGISTVVDENLEINKEETDEIIQAKFINQAQEKPVTETPAEKPLSESQDNSGQGGLISDLLKTFGGEIIS